MFNRTSGVSLTDAFAASCAVPGIWPPVTIRRGRYIDGGARSHTNADFAADCSRVLVILPLQPGGRLAAALAAELKGLRTRAKVLPREDGREGQACDGQQPPAHLLRRHAMVDVGRAQATEAAEEVARLWK